MHLWDWCLEASSDWLSRLFYIWYVVLWISETVWRVFRTDSRQWYLRSWSLLLPGHWRPWQTALVHLYLYLQLLKALQAGWWISFLQLSLWSGLLSHLRQVLHGEPLVSWSRLLLMYSQEQIMNWWSSLFLHVWQVLYVEITVHRFPIQPSWHQQVHSVNM